MNVRLEIECDVADISLIEENMLEMESASVCSSSLISSIAALNFFCSSIYVLIKLLFFRIAPLTSFTESL